MENSISNPFDQINTRLSRIEDALQAILVFEAPKLEAKWYSIPDAAPKLNVSQITLYRNAKAGKIPSKKIGQRVMIPGSFVDK